MIYSFTICITQRKWGNRQLVQVPSTSLEVLPNELFIEILSYLNGVDAVIAFANLNYRLQCLLNKYSQFFNFKSKRKAKFDYVFQQHDTRQWKSLQLSNDDHTPGQIDYFIKNYLFTECFLKVESLRIVKIKHIYKYNALIDLLIQYFTNLNVLTIESICGTTMSSYRLPKLKRLVISSCRNAEWIMVILFKN